MAFHHIDHISWPAAFTRAMAYGALRYPFPQAEVGCISRRGGSGETATLHAEPREPRPGLVNYRGREEKGTDPVCWYAALSEKEQRHGRSLSHGV